MIYLQKVFGSSMKRKIKWLKNGPSAACVLGGEVEGVSQVVGCTVGLTRNVQLRFWDFRIPGPVYNKVFWA